MAASDTASRESPRELIEQRVAERAARVTAEQVEETCSFARAERILGREYHGRFLIELLQNAADAWRATRAGTERTDVRVVLSDAPALLVANKGTTFPASAVIKSLGHIGRSTKSRGEAIGHKGIGFKSVLELTLCPELYSGLAELQPTLAVRFDPRAALEVIRESSPEWDALIAEVDDIEDPLSAVPILRYPMWVDELPGDVKELAADGFDTVVRLPFRYDLRPDPHLGLDKWLETVRAGFLDLTDQMLLLLGMFKCVEIDDRLAKTNTTIAPRWGDDEALGDATAREHVSVDRNAVPTSKWHLYRRTLGERADLSGEIAVGVRLDLESGRVIGALPDMPSTPFHLFFPTRIGSGLPFLLHGYFEVDAARTGFYDGSAAQNEAILVALSDLVATAVADIAGQEPRRLVSLPDLLGDGAAPENRRALEFRDRALAKLDNIEWVSVEQGTAVGPLVATPLDLLVDEDVALVERIVGTFSATYVAQRTGWQVPDRDIGSAGHRYLQSRQPDRDVWEALELLLRPGASGPWPEGVADEGFRALLDLVAALQLNDRARAVQLLAGLRGDEEACLLPAVAEGGGRTMLPVPDPGEAVAGRRSKLVMARTRNVGRTELVPPAFMDVAFLPAGLLDSEGQVDRAKPLGVRDFTVDNVLDRMRGGSRADADPSTVLTFLWSLLVRERRSEFSSQAAADHASEFNPATFFWCRPGHGAHAGAEADRQRRRRVLAVTLLPARDGSWRPASRLAFGDSWAAWLERGACGPQTTALQTRARCYRGLSAIAPSDADLLADPEDVLAWMSDIDVQDDEEVERPEINVEKHSFLLMLGVWEVFPVEGFESREQRNRPHFPFEGPLNDERSQRIEASGGWEFVNHPWSGNGHLNVWIAEDFRFLWSLPEAADRDAGTTAQLLSAGASLYATLDSLAAFCPSCTSGTWHSKRYQTSHGDRYPSILALELQKLRWVPAIFDGQELEAAQLASSVWWTEKPPGGAGLRQSPLRYLTLCQPSAEITSALRSLARIPRLESAGIGRIEALLRDLRDDYDAGSLAVDPHSSSSARQAFIGLHRLAYERLDDLTSPESGKAREVLERVGVLCELGDALVYRQPADVRHDDGHFVSYRRFFDGRVPFAVLARDRGPVATRLGLSSFVVELVRRENTETRDVTDEVAEYLGERVPELLAILIHHSLGTQTLEPSSQQFEERARRLRNLRVYQVDDLVIDAHVVGTDESAVIGEGSAQDVFLEAATSSQPGLYHDIRGETWRETFRRKLPVHLAVLVENPAYAATFALFLLAETDAEREEVLRDLGVSVDDVDAIRSSVGAVSEEEKNLQRRWFAAVVKCLGREDLVSTLGSSDSGDALERAGLSKDVAARLAELGGGADVRRDASPDGPLWLLETNGVALSRLDDALRDEDRFDGLSVDVAQRRLAAWIRSNRRHVAAVLAQRRDPDEAKNLPSGWKASPELRLALDPAPADWLGAVVDSMHAAGFSPDVDALAERPVAELVRLAGVAAPGELDALVAQLYDREEQERILRAAAAAWRNELAFLAVLARTQRGDSRAAIRAQADLVEDGLPVAPPVPSDLRASATGLFATHPSLADVLVEQLNDVLAALPERGALLNLAREHGVGTAHRSEVERALEAPKSELARKLRANIAQLSHEEVRPVTPPGLQPAKRPEPPPDDGRTKRKVAAVKVGAGADARKRRAGDEGERWALAAVLADLVGLSAEGRRKAIDAITALLDDFEGKPVEKARSHAEPACDPQLDEEELIDELTGLLHVSRLSDGFGFDLLGWLPLEPDAAPTAVCMEVKSTRDGTFHLSRNEWGRALWFHERGEGERYVVLVVHRSPGSAPPQRMDILADPVHLVETKQISKVDDGYELSYRVSRERTTARPAAVPVEAKA
jgi:hypothetical protein